MCIHCVALHRLVSPNPNTDAQIEIMDTLKSKEVTLIFLVCCSTSFVNFVKSKNLPVLCVWIKHNMYVITCSNVFVFDVKRTLVCGQENTPFFNLFVDKKIHHFLTWALCLLLLL